MHSFREIGSTDKYIQMRGQKDRSMCTSYKIQTGQSDNPVFHAKQAFTHICLIVCLSVCVEVLRPSEPNGVMSSAVSLPNHTFTGQASSSKRLTSKVNLDQKVKSVWSANIYLKWRDDSIHCFYKSMNVY